MNGKYLVVKPYVPLDFSSGLSAEGEPIPIPDKDPSVGGSINIVNASNWPAPAYSPRTGLVYVNSVEGKAIYYVTRRQRQALGLRASSSGTSGWPMRCLKFPWACRATDSVCGGY